MQLYQGLVLKQKDDKYFAVILKLTQDSEPCCDTVMEHETDDEGQANIWLDDEMSRLTTGKGVWDV